MIPSYFGQRGGRSIRRGSNFKGTRTGGLHSVVYVLLMWLNDSSRVSCMPQRLRIRNFNPHIARNYHAEDKSGWLGQFVEGELTSTISCPFTEAIGSALPYREIVSEELFNFDGRK